ncbi:hypothetical protein DJ535_12025 [Citrobacter murliniae]|uniref:Uncharacterized protein n=1 Tax=Citrobacter murliniae TaxID=67829 RepID=A0ABY2PUL6_9ENTR|nr:hypothetical protein DJ535_12025 [Citrobacter murliniae]
MPYVIIMTFWLVLLSERRELHYIREVVEINHGFLIGEAAGITLSKIAMSERRNYSLIIGFRTV